MGDLEVVFQTYSSSRHDGRRAGDSRSLRGERLRFIIFLYELDLFLEITSDLNQNDLNFSQESSRDDLRYNL